MKTIYVINYDTEFFITEIPILTESDQMYIFDYERLTTDQHRALDWEDTLNKSEENTTNWTTDKTRFETLKRDYIKNKLAQLNAGVICATSRFDRAVLSAHQLGFMF